MNTGKQPKAEAGLLNALIPSRRDVQAKSKSQPTFVDALLSPRDGQKTKQSQQPGPCALEFSPEYVFWALQNMPVNEAATHFLICGTPGSGKTVSIRLLLQSIVPRIRMPASDEKLIVFDPKRDMISLLSGMLPDLTVEDPDFWILNPFDARCAVWDMAEDINSDANALYFATLLVPPDTNSNAPYFSDAAREIIRAVVLTFIHRFPGKWTLRDLILAVRNKERIEAVTNRYDEAQDIVQPFLADEKHLPSVLTTISTKLGKLNIVAALWHNAKSGRKFSIKKFSESRGIVVLGNHPVYHDSLWPINAMLLKLSSDSILKGEETDNRKYWMVLDEFRWMGRVDCVRQLLNQGRSKGVSVLLGIQDVDGLMAVYGEKEANELLGGCANKSFFRAGTPSSADWASKHFGVIRAYVNSYSESWGRGGSTSSVSSTLQDMPALTGTMFADLPLPKSGFFGAVHDVPWLRTSLITKRPFSEVKPLLKNPGPLKNEDKRDDWEQELKRWTPEEEARFIDSNQSGSPGKSLAERFP